MLLMAMLLIVAPSAGARTPQTITGFAPATPINYSDRLTFDLSATGGGSGNSVVFASTTPTICTVFVVTVSVQKVGTCTLTANQAGNTKYNAATQVTANVVINKGINVITFGSLSNQFYGAAPLGVSATATSGSAVAFTTTTPTVCTVSGSTVTVVNLGTCTIAANQAGNSNFNAATQVTQSFTVTQAIQTIAFGTLANQVYGAAPFTLSAITSSGLPAIFSSTTTPVCTVAGSTVTLHAVGICSILAYQAGNANYGAAQRTQSFSVSIAEGVQDVIGQISYVYDELGRLVSVSDAAGNTATYLYDAVGNILSVSRSMANQVSLSNFTPTSGPAGTVVTIFGSGFSTTASQNSITFNQAAATIISASATQIVASVPAGATTGVISLSTPAGSTSSTVPFTVGLLAPTITGFTPSVGVVGTSVTITGSNYQETVGNNRIAFNNHFTGVASATSTSILAQVSTSATSGRIAVNTPNGIAVSSADFYVVPSPHTVADLQVSGRMNFGQSEPVTLSSASAVALFVFDGGAGQSVSLVQSASSFVNGRIYLRDPNGVGLSGIQLGDVGGFMDGTKLPMTGTYTIMYEPETSGGSATLTLYDAQEIIRTVTISGPPATISTVPGQNASLMFNGAAGQQVTVHVTANSLFCPTINVNNPDGSLLLSPGACNANFDIALPTLVASGLYKIAIHPYYSTSGSITIGVTSP